MKNLNESSSITLLQRIFWWCSGVNISLLVELKTSWQKFYTVGLAIILSSLVSALSFIGACIFHVDEYLDIIQRMFYVFIN